jgi:hypothetical protein
MKTFLHVQRGVRVTYRQTLIDSTLAASFMPDPRTDLPLSTVGLSRRTV